MGGFYSSWKVKKGGNAAKARKEAITIGCVFMLVSLVLTAVYLDSLKENIPLAIGLISITLFGFQFLINNIQTLPADYFNGKNVGTVAGMGGTTAVAGTLLMIWIVPRLTSYVWFFILGAVMVPLAWICVTFIRSSVKPKPSAKEEELSTNESITN